jgi:hypothetical protein
MKKSTITPTRQPLAKKEGFSDLNEPKSTSNVPFLKTSRGKAVLAAAIIVPTLLVAGGLAGGLAYYFTRFDSTIMTSKEKEMLMNLGKFSSMNLIYRASTDGFHAFQFHDKCDNITNIVAVFKSHRNNVFGGYTSVGFDSTGGSKSDSEAFLFLLRNNNVTLAPGERFNIRNNSQGQNCAIYDYYNYNPIFGCGHDLYIESRPDVNSGSHTWFCYSYECSSTFNNSAFPTSESQKYLAGTYNFVVLDFEVYKVAF